MCGLPNGRAVNEGILKQMVGVRSRLREQTSEYDDGGQYSLLLSFCVSVFIGSLYFTQLGSTAVVTYDAEWILLPRSRGLDIPVSSICLLSLS